MPLVEAAELLHRVPSPPQAPAKTCRSVQPHDASLDHAALLQLAEQLQAELSPLVALEPLDAQPWAGKPLHQPDSLLCDITGVSHLFGGEAGLLRAAESLLGRRGLKPQMAIAETAGAAWGWAHYRSQSPDPPDGAGHHHRQPTVDTQPEEQRGAEDARVLPVDALPDALDPLPIAALRIDVSTAATLRRLGVTSVGALRGFPRDGLASRLGQRLLERMAQAFGEVDEPLRFHHSQPENRQQLELEYPTAELAILQDRLERLVERACRQLAEHQRGALRLECRLDSADQEPCRLQIGLFAPTADAIHLGRLLSGSLESKRCSAPITRLTLMVTLTAPLRHVQTALFPHGTEADGEEDAAQRVAVGRLVDTLSGRLGPDAVVGVRLRKTPLPENAFTSFPLTGRPRPRRRRQPSSTQPSAASSQAPASSQNQRPSCHPGPSPGDPLRRPLTLLHQPLPLADLDPTAGERPGDCPNRFRLGGKVHHIVQAWGPERIETGWWHGPTIRRDYFRMLTDRGECWWVFRELAPGSNGQSVSHNHAWRLHGRFA